MRHFFVISFFLFSLLTFNYAFADFLVLKSNVENIKKNQTIGDEEKVVIPKGKEITVLNNKTKKNLTIKGLYEGTITAFKPKRRNFWQTILDIFFGEREETEKDVGGTRGGIKKKSGE